MIAVCARQGLGSFVELSKVPLPVLRALHDDAIEVEVAFNPLLSKK